VQASIFISPWEGMDTICRVVKAFSAPDDAPVAGTRP